MHAYGNAIPRSHGDYVLYPGQEAKELRGFHELRPGLSAIALRPGSGIGELASLFCATWWPMPATGPAPGSSTASR